MDKRLIAGKYAIIKKIATGGMAEVFLAQHIGLDGFQKLVVLKRILPHLCSEQEYVRMFLDEARTVADLQHGNIVATFEVGEESGMYFLAMEYLHGQDLRAIFKACQSYRNTDQCFYASGMLMDICAGLHYAHTKENFKGESLGIVHRDISPQNIIITYDGVPKIFDFGIAKAVHHTWLTRSGVLKGKCSYMSPEQVLGQELDCRSDIYSLGIVLYELATLKRLFQRGSELLTCKAIIEADIIKPSVVIADFPKKLEHIVMKALARKPADRFTSADDFRCALEQFQHESAFSHSTHKLGRLVKKLFKHEYESSATDYRKIGSTPFDRLKFWPLKNAPEKLLKLQQNKKKPLLVQLIVSAILGGIIGVILVLYALTETFVPPNQSKNFVHGALAIDFDKFRKSMKDASQGASYETDDLCWGPMGRRG